MTPTTQAPNQLESPRIARITDRGELEGRLLYSLIVAGKSAKFADAAIGRWYEAGREMIGGDFQSPFELIQILVERGQLEESLRKARTGNYRKLARAFDFLRFVYPFPDLTTVTPEILEHVPGIGPKTSRFFILWTRPEARVAALDTHVLKWLRFLGHKCPKSTPSEGLNYSRLETVVLAEADKRGMTPRELDSKIWDWCQAGNHKDGLWPEDLQPR